MSDQDGSDDNRPGCKGWLQLLFFLIVVLPLLVLGGGAILDTISDSVNGSGGRTDVLEETENGARLGQEGVQVLVEFDEKCAGGRSVLVDIEFEIENGRDEALHVNPLHFKLENPAGERFTYENYGGFAREIGPDGTTSGRILFQAGWNESYEGEEWTVLYEPTGLWEVQMAWPTRIEKNC